MSDLVGNPEDRFSCVPAQFLLKEAVVVKACVLLSLYEPRHEETNNVVSDQVKHKLSCTSAEDG